jgi:hypothetical protein
VATYNGPECNKCGSTERYLPRTNRREKTGACVQCKLSKSAAWRKDNPEKHTAAILGWRKNNPERIKQIERRRACKRRADPEEKHKIKARAHINRKVIRRELDRIETLVCRRCSNQAVDYHHPDYDKPWLVIPLCKDCHCKEHNG